jgi:hypothetical protein
MKITHDVWRFFRYRDLRNPEVKWLPPHGDVLRLVEWSEFLVREYHTWMEVFRTLVLVFDEVIANPVREQLETEGALKFLSIMPGGQIEATMPDEIFAVSGWGIEALVNCSGELEWPRGLIGLRAREGGVIQLYATIFRQAYVSSWLDVPGWTEGFAIHPGAPRAVYSDPSIALGTSLHLDLSPLADAATDCLAAIKAAL